jgi:ribosomal protein S18 acetylase RimI-like enzyme
LLIMSSADGRPFADTDLAARVELAELSLIQQSAEATGRRVPNGRTMTIPLGGGLAVWAGPDSPLDKVVGVLDADFTDRALSVVERAYAERGAPVSFEIATLADPDVFERLAARGYRLVGFENVLGQTVAEDAAATVADGLAIEQVEPGDLDLFVDLQVEADLAPDTEGVPAHEDYSGELIAAALRDMAATDGFSGWLARIDGEPAGAASLRIVDGVAQFCGAATLPALRRRGVQTSLVSARLAYAGEQGCDLAVVTVQPGSRSQQNVQRQGFELLYARAILTRTESSEGAS